MRQIAIKALLALSTVHAAHAAGSDHAPAGDLDALTLADKAVDTPAQQPLQWRLFVEGAGGAGKLRDGGSSFTILRGSLDFRLDAKLDSRWRAVFSDRLDLVDSDGIPPGENVNTLREAFVSWSRTDHQIFDVGRVNIRNGAAVGFNPTDWFKANALRAIVNPDPAVLRENRQGTVVLQGQQVWDNAALSGAFSPRLARSPDSATFALNPGATNPENRYLLAGSYRLGDKLNPQLLVYGGADISPQLGLNLSTLVGDSTVVYGEFAVGKGISLTAQALSQTEPQSYQQRASVGLTYTAPFNLELSAEAQYNSAAPTSDQWHGLSGAAQQQLLSTAQALQDLPTRRQLFFYASFKDMVVRRFDLSGFLWHDLQTRSQNLWLEGRYSWQRTELALQWQLYTGPVGSLYYAVPQQQTLQLVLRVYI
jgi:hypothetical protein